MLCLGEDGAEANTREDVHVVALTGFVSLAVDLDRLVWASRGEDDGSVCPAKCCEIGERRMENEETHQLTASA